METIDQALSKVHLKFSTYFRWKFGLIARGKKQKERTLEDIMRQFDVKAQSTFDVWEKSEQYKHLIEVYINGQSANDLVEVYQVVVAKAKDGDTKAIDTMLKLQKQIANNLKQSKKSADPVDEEDDLEL